MADDPSNDEDTFRAAPTESMDDVTDPELALPEEPAITFNLMLLRGVQFLNLKESSVKFGDHIR